MKSIVSHPAERSLRQIVADWTALFSLDANILAIPRLDITVKHLFRSLIFALVCLSTAHADAPADVLFASTLSNPDNKPVALSSYKGKPLVVNFWARWCPPCRAEIPELAAFRKKHQGRIEVLGIGIEDDADAVRDFVKAYEMTYPVFLAREQGLPLMKALGNARGGLPFTVFIDSHGNIIEQKLGRLQQRDLDAAAANLLKR